MAINDTIYNNFLDSLPDEMPQKYIALTEKESNYLSRAEDITSKFNRNFIIIDDTGEKMYSFPENYRELLASELVKKRLSLKKVESITNRVLNGKWYCLILAGDKEPELGNLSFYFVHDSAESKGEFLEDNSPYYSLFDESLTSTEEYCLKERELLGLTPEHKVIFSTEYFTLLKFYNIQKIENSREKVVEKWKIKSSPMLIMPVRIGRPAINNAEDGIRTEKGRKIISIGNYKCSYNPNKASVAVQKNVNAQKLMDLVQCYAFITSYKTTRLKIPMKDILEIRGLKDMKELKRQLTSAAALLDDMNFTGQLGNGDFDKIAFTQGDTSIKQGYLYLNINERFLEGLRETKQELLYNPELQKLPSKGFSYGFARLFEEHKRRNAGQPNENRLAVATLLEASPYPTIDELPTPGHASQKIIEPFLKCFDQIEEYGIFSYRLCKKGGIDLSEKEYNQALSDFSFFSTLLVEVHYFKNTEPNYSKLIDLKAKANGKSGAKLTGSAKNPAQHEQKKPVKRQFRLQKN